MRRNSEFWSRLGAVGVLLAIVLLLLWGTRSADWRRLFVREENAPLLAEPAGTPTGAIIAGDTSEEPLNRSGGLGEGTAATVSEPEFDLAAMPVLVDNSLVANPKAITYKPSLPEHQFITYTVQAGDTAIGIAEQFGIREETLLGGNEFLSNDASALQPGAVLIILPIDGALHTVNPGDTLEGLSTQYDIPQEDIIAYVPNNLTFPYRLEPDTQILIPGAVVEAFFWEPPVTIVTASSGSSAEALQGIYVANLGTGSFSWPIGSRNISQYYWYGHPGLDVAAVEGSAVTAADTGTVTFAAWSPYCYGYLIVLNHGNGYETFYAHLSGIYVSPGQVVNKGVTIGASGNTGCSSGPHLHFEIRFNRGRYDPLSYLP
jgi:murein DD-endopeptidase MepM/ murein hydrolase activator NlpD